MVIVDPGISFAMTTAMSIYVTVSTRTPIWILCILGSTEGALSIPMLRDFHLIRSRRTYVLRCYINIRWFLKLKILPLKDAHCFWE